MQPPAALLESTEAFPMSPVCPGSPLKHLTQEASWLLHQFPFKEVSGSTLSSFLQRKLISTACMLLHLSLWVKGEGGNTTSKSTLHFHSALSSFHHKIRDIILLSCLYNYFKNGSCDRVVSLPKKFKPVLLEVC